MNNKNSHIDVMPKIKSVYPSLPPSSKKVADYVINNSNKVIYFTVSELAEKANVSDSTIIRFCKQVGFKGYQEFKLILAQSLVVPIENINEDIKIDDSLKSIINKIDYSNKQVIEETTSITNISEMKKAIKLICEAKNVIFFGVGTSGITCWDAKIKFLRIGINTDCYTDAHLQAMYASSLSNQDVVVGISHSGSTKDVVYSCKLAKEAGAHIICVTGHSHSPLTKIADIKLLTATKELPLSGGPLRSKIAQLHLLDLIFTGVALKQYDRTIKYTEKTADAVLNKLY